jgi:hypothetical protein
LRHVIFCRVPQVEEVTFRGTTLLCFLHAVRVSSQIIRSWLFRYGCTLQDYWRSRGTRQFLLYNLQAARKLLLNAGVGSDFVSSRTRQIQFDVFT